MVQLVIAEKPSAARDLARVLDVRPSGKGCFDLCHGGTDRSDDRPGDDHAARPQEGGRGQPPGFQVATEDLDTHKTSKVLSAYEITGKQLMLYLSALPASGTQTFKYRLQATMPVTASDGGAEVYLYYQSTLLGDRVKRPRQVCAVVGPNRRRR